MQCSFNSKTKEQYHSHYKKYVLPLINQSTHLEVHSSQLINTTVKGIMWKIQSPVSVQGHRLQASCWPQFQKRTRTQKEYTGWADCRVGLGGLNLPESSLAILICLKIFFMYFFLCLIKFAQFFGLSFAQLLSLCIMCRETLEKVKKVI